MNHIVSRGNGMFYFRDRERLRQIRRMRSRSKSPPERKLGRGVLESKAGRYSSGLTGQPNPILTLQMKIFS